jgi:copper chaperone CopZ
MALLLVCLFVVACRQHDYRTITIHVPEMKTQRCATLVRRALSSVRGAERRTIDIDLKARTVTVTYDSLFLSLKNLEFAIAGAGFQANNVPAKGDALKALPSECKPGPVKAE